MLKFRVNYFKTAYAERVFSHAYDEEWKKTKHYCPNCGAKSVWSDTSPGDYYVGEQFLCLDCGCSFFLPNFYNGPIDEQDKQRVTAIKNRIKQLD